MTSRTISFLCQICLSLFLESCNETAKPERAVYGVRIPPFYEAKLTAGENHCIFAYWWHPPPGKDIDIDFACKNAPLPNDGVPLEVDLKPDGSLYLNNDVPVGHLSDTSALRDRLRDVFRNHEEMGVYRPESADIDKSIAVDVPLSAQYGDLVKLLEAVKSSGSDEIILSLDGHLPKNLVIVQPGTK